LVCIAASIAEKRQRTGGYLMANEKLGITIHFSDAELKLLDEHPEAIFFVGAMIFLGCAIAKELRR
jgi:hypothetical protein